MFTTHSFARVAAGTAGAALFAAFCLTAAVAPAAAEPVSRTVSYADLNLSSSAGRAVLQTRIKAAARAVCKDEGYDVAARARETTCVKTAISHANAS